MRSHLLHLAVTRRGFPRRHRALEMTYVQGISASSPLRLLAVSSSATRFFASPRECHQSGVVCAVSSTSCAFAAGPAEAGRTSAGALALPPRAVCGAVSGFGSARWKGAEVLSASLSRTSWLAMHCRSTVWLDKMLMASIPGTSTSNAECDELTLASTLY